MRTSAIKAAHTAVWPAISFASLIGVVVLLLGYIGGKRLRQSSISAIRNWTVLAEPHYW